MFVINHRKIWYTISGILVAVSIFFIAYDGLNFGIEFTGGSLLEGEYTDVVPNIAEIRSVVEVAFGGSFVQLTDEAGVVVRTQSLDEDGHSALKALLGQFGTFEERQFNSIGPVIGVELKRKAITALILVVVLIVLFIAFVFRKVSHGMEKGHAVSSLNFGLMAVVATLHDIIIPTGIFAILGATLGIEIDLLFVTALLAILGFSVNDTIVVFDRVRENLALKISKNFDEVVGISLRQTLARSINTSLTTLFVLLTLLFFGGETTRLFALALTIGIVVGTYSSIFIASPLLVTIQKYKEKKHG